MRLLHSPIFSHLQGISVSVSARYDINIVTHVMFKNISVSFSECERYLHDKSDVPARI